MISLLIYYFSWEGSGLDEVGKEKDSGHIRVKVNKKYFRPAEVVSFIFFIKYKNTTIIFSMFKLIQCFFKDYLLGDASKAKSKLNWEPKTSFQVTSLHSVHF